MPTLSQRIETATETLEADVALQHQIVNGDSSTVVVTGSGNVSSLAKVIADLNSNFIAGMDSAFTAALEAYNTVQKGLITASGLTAVSGKLLGRASAATGAIEEITIGAGLALDGSGNLTASSTSAVWGAITGTLSSQSDLATALGLKAPLVSPTFSGSVIIPTVAGGSDNTTKAASTAFVQAALAAATLTESQITGLTTDLAAKAPLISPAFTGIPTTTTASPNNNSTRIASTAYVDAAIATLVGGAPGALDTLNELATALGDDASFATSVTNSLALKAPLASPSLTGTPTAPTASGGNNSTQLATTAFVQAALTAYTAPITWDGSGHYIFGGGSYYNYPGPTKATVTINGSFACLSTFETAFVNNTAHGVMDTPWNTNVISIQATATDKCSAIRYLDTNSYEVGAMGYCDPANGYPWGGTTFISTSPQYDTTTGSPHSSTPGGIALVWEGKDANMSAYLYYRRFEIASDGTCYFQFPYHSNDYSGNDVGGSALGNNPQLTISGPNTSGNSYVNLKSYGNGGGGQAGYNAVNYAGNAIGFGITGPEFSTYHSLVADYGSINSGGSNGLGIYASAGGGVMRFFTGGIDTSNERMRIAANGKIGIGTTSPAYELDVSGDASITGTLHGNGTLADGWLAVTQTENDNSTKVATTAYVDAAVAGVSGGGMSNPMTSIGDIILGGASGTPERLAAGSDGQILTMASGSPAWADSSGASTDLLPRTILVTTDVYIPNDSTEVLRISTVASTTYRFCLTGKAKGDVTDPLTFLFSLDSGDGVAKVFGVLFYDDALTNDNGGAISFTDFETPAFGVGNDPQPTGTFWLEGYITLDSSATGNLILYCNGTNGSVYAGTQLTLTKIP